MIRLNGTKIEPTIFPDGTSQVWKVNFTLYPPMVHEIRWDYENESELIQVCQLNQLLRSHYGGHYSIVLIMSYLPYARQDKEISNYTTFGLNTFITILNSFNFSQIRVLDAHNSKAFPWTNIIPNERIEEVIEESKSTIICFPDKGASERGYDIKGLPSFSLDKKRDQMTGEIIGLKCDLPLDLTGHKVLILDDICDRGGTFIAASKILNDMGAESVSLYTTHGLYTGGTNIIFDSGISRIFNYKGEVLDRT